MRFISRSGDMDVPDQLLRVLYNFEYSKDGRNVWMKEGETLSLLKKTNPDWWQVIRTTEKRPFYVPAAYVEELNPGKTGKIHQVEKVVCADSKRTIVPARDKLSETNLFKEFPVSDTKDSESCNNESKEKCGDDFCNKDEREDESVQEGEEQEEEARRLLHDKRKSWAAEELVSELTQMAIARGEPAESDYVNLHIDGERFVIAADEEAPLFWQPSVRNNPMSSSDELDNSDSLVQNHCAAWLSKYSLSSEGDKTDESVQSFHSLGNESVNSRGRPWRDEDGDSSPYAHVTCTASSVVSMDTSGTALAGLKLSESLERLAGQIKFPAEDNEDVPVVPIAPPREYEAPVYENIDVRVKAGPAGHKTVTDEDSVGESENETRRSPEAMATASSDPDQETARSQTLNQTVILYNERSEEVNSKETLDDAKASDDRADDEQLPSSALLEGMVDVKQKIALWNNSGVDSERLDRFDEAATSRTRPSRAVRPAHRPAGLVKSASESRVSALRGLYAAALEASDSGSEDFLDAAGPVAVTKQRGALCLNPEGDNLDASDSGLSNKSDEAAMSDANHRRTALMRSRRVESCRRYQRAPRPPRGPPRPHSPPPPSPGQEAARLLAAGWAEFRAPDGRSFYCHATSGQRRWKPPRRQAAQDSARSTSSSPRLDDEDAENENEALAVPQGWRAVMDPTGQLCYVHPHKSTKWFSSSDNKGRMYFFEENSCESTWNLPDISLPTLLDKNSLGSDSPPSFSTGSEEKSVKTDRNEKQERFSLRNAKSRSMVIVDSGIKDSKNLPSPKNWPQLFDGDMCILKEGPMFRTKITENGKKLRKNWASCHVVLSELFLLLFRDVKSFAVMKSSTLGSTASRPELCVDLNGALIDQVDRGEKASVTSRKNVFLVSTVLGLQVLFQCDCNQQAEEWYNAVYAAIHNLPSGFDSCPRIKLTKEVDRLFGDINLPEQSKKFSRIGRSKSVKIKNKDGSIEDLTVSVAERQTKIKARLKKFFNRRPTMDSLVKKGIWKDEPAFGCYLDQVSGSESPRIPLFVQRCITVIEGSEDNMKTDGLYRASGNLSQVQKIRLQVDQNNLSALDHEEDVHVLTGALKLFFRELKEPLIPYAAFSKAIKASTLQNKKEKLSQFREIVKSLPTANHDTLKFLLKHLLKVTGYQEFNRMHIPNLAIVFGPTLMWPEQESLNMALDLMQQNLVIEAFLLDFENIFR